MLNDDEIKVDYNADGMHFHYLPRSGYYYLSSFLEWEVVNTNYRRIEETEFLLSVREKLRFVSTFWSVSWSNFVSEEDSHSSIHPLDIKHPYLKFFKGIE